jgi:hypothetical protein
MLRFLVRPGKPVSGESRARARETTELTIDVRLDARNALNPLSDVARYCIA